MRYYYTQMLSTAARQRHSLLRRYILKIYGGPFACTGYATQAGEYVSSRSMLPRSPKPFGDYSSTQENRFSISQATQREKERGRESGGGGKRVKLEPREIIARISVIEEGRDCEEKRDGGSDGSARAREKIQRMTTRGGSWCAYR